MEILAIREESKAIEVSIEIKGIVYTGLLKPTDKLNNIPSSYNAYKSMFTSSCLFNCVNKDKYNLYIKRISKIDNLIKEDAIRKESLISERELRKVIYFNITNEDNENRLKDINNLLKEIDTRVDNLIREKDDTLNKIRVLKLDII